ncbi:hypothetical protein [Silvibacterium sp.]|uniref:hypothetical protein n=1 Tax=Silvibacterium sp. TaxID=1964179 RepID=UPI0039E29A2D
MNDLGNDPEKHPGIDLRRSNRFSSLSCLCLGAASLFFAPHSLAAQATPDSVASDPVPLVRRAAENELKSSSLHPYRYQLHKIDDGRISTKMIVETKDGDVARLVAYGDKPLGPIGYQNEVDRLKTLLDHPEIQEHRRKREQEDSNRANEMIRMLPDAFLYHSEGLVDGPSGPAFRLTLKPNPSFHPPDREAEVYAGMEGELWIDQKQERMVRLDVHLIDDVNFGWGILGKLYKGGSILVEQKDVGDGHWEQFHFKMDLHGKALMFKTLNLSTTEDESDFAPVSAGWGYQDAVKFLLAQNPPMGPPAQN